jgi:hypothetical protein
MGVKRQHQCKTKINTTDSAIQKVPKTQDSKRSPDTFQENLGDCRSGNRSEQQQPRVIQAKPTFRGLSRELNSENAASEATSQAALNSTESYPANKTGLPDRLKTGIESLSGMAMDDVRVHYNSSKPTQLQALAYTQGSDIHVAPGQEKHLPHEAWHVVQQMQRRVKPTMQVKDVGMNDDVGLEREADQMGGRALGIGQMEFQANHARPAIASRLPSATQSTFNSQALGQPHHVPQPISTNLSVRQFRCGSKKKAKDKRTIAQQIMEDYPVTEPRIVFRYDSRPIALALEKGYVAENPEAADITEGGENQNMVGGGHNFVGPYSYRGYAKVNAHSKTKQTWKGGKNTFYWTAAVVRSGGMTYEWLLNKITDEGDRERMREIVLTRTEGSPKTDQELIEIAGKYDFQGTRNIGTTEIVTDKIFPEDILGYFEIQQGEDPVYYEVRPIEKIKGYEDIPREDIVRYQKFQETGGSIKPSRFL